MPMQPMGDPNMMGGMPPQGDPNAMGGAPQGDPNAMGGDPNMMGGMPPQGDPNAMGGDPNMMGEMPPQDNQGSEYDTNFDAGVEADEDEDPKKYVQQLTGKLSQSLDSYLNDLGQADPSLCKYVGKMIVRQCAKGLDDKGRKDLIKSIKMVSAEEDASQAPQEGENNQQEGEPMMETAITKSMANELVNEICGMCETGESRKELPKKQSRTKKETPFTAKTFK